MTFVDTNVFVYAVGNPHPLQQEAWDFFERTHEDSIPLCTSAEVLQELVHVLVSMSRYQSFDSAMDLVADFAVEVLPLEREDVLLARRLHEQHPALSARDLCHLASCQRRDVGEMMTFDLALASAFPDATA
jgi:predicted nucleic acid-binding protein